MKCTPEDLRCDICSAPATIHLRDTTAGTEHLYCDQHKPDLWPGKNPKLAVLRYRRPPTNPCSQMLAAPRDSEEHRTLRHEMCDVRLLGGEGACRYYLSILTECDQFTLWSDEFNQNVREFVLRETNGAATAFRFDVDTVDLMEPLVKSCCQNAGQEAGKKLTKEDRAVVLLLRHPNWSDDQIAKAVPTTRKQLQRFTTYKALRLARNRM